MKICFPCTLIDKTKLQLAIAKYLESSKKVTPIYLVETKGAASVLKENGIDKKKVFEVSYIDWDKTKYSIKILEGLEKKYGLPNLWIYWDKIRSTIHNSNKEALQMMQTMFVEYEKFFDSAKPQAIIIDNIASLPQFIFYNIARAKKIPLMMYMPSKIPNKFIVKSDINDVWHEPDAIFEKLKSKDLTSVQVARTKKFLDEFKHKNIQPTYTKFLRKRRFFSFRSVRLVTKMFYEFYAKQGKTHYRYKTKLLPFYHVGTKVTHKVKESYLRVRSPFSKPVKGEKYVLFPLQYQPEASTLIKAPYFLNQLHVVSNLAKSLPIGYKLYVKEHNNGVGRRELSFFKKIKKLPQVKLIGPRASIHSLIKNSKLVITITSTTGWEAILYDKPVITLGSTFFNSYDDVVKVTDFTKLSAAINDLLKNYKPNTGLKYKYLLAHMLGSHKGVPAGPDSCGGLSLKEGNVKLLGDALFSNIKI